MTTVTKRTIYLLAFLIAGFAISRSATASDTMGHLISLSVKIDRQATNLLRETVHYRHTPHYPEMVAEVAKLRVKARHMRITTFTSRNFHHLEEDLAMVDRCFHVVEDFFDHAEIDAVRGYGRIHGNTRHVKEMLNCMEDTIHHMQDDVRALRRSICGSRSRTSRAIYGGSRSIYDGPSSVILLGGFDDDCRIDRGHRRHRYEDFRRGERGPVRSHSGFSISNGNMSLRIKF